MNRNMPARIEGTQYEVVERNVVGSVEYIEGVIGKLSSQGFLVAASPIAYNGQQGTYAVVQFRKPVGVHVPGATPANLPAIRTSTGVAQIEVGPKAARGVPRWAIRTGIIATVVGLAVGLVAWVISQVASAVAAVDGKMVVGFVVIAVIVAVILYLKSRGGGRGHGGGQRMGFHYGPCD